ncbi:sensor histidine kinase [soil metagenome]
MTTTEPGTARRPLYGRLWADLPRGLAYLFISFPIALVGFALTVSLFSAGFGTIVTFFIGLVLLVACLYIARGFGALDVNLVSWAARMPIPMPEWQDARARTGFLGWVRAVLGNGHYWLYLLQVMVIDFVVKTITWTVMITWTATALGGISYWLWNLFIPRGDQDWFLSRWLFPHAGFNTSVADAIIYAVIGLVLLATLPFVIRGLVLVHWFIARGVLGAWQSDALKREVATLAESRGAAHSAEGHSLRRLERDIHDGPQQRLVRLQMDLAAAERQLDSDPAAARGLISEAMQQSKDALEELRALSRGFAPPILLDRGLVAALESAAARSTIPAHVVSELPEGAELPQEIERNAYFAASEALVNADKHSGATEIEVRVAMRVEEQTWLDIAVSDNGSGGAFVIAGHGIAGLQERMRGLGGTLEVLSPAGGPTVVTAHLPITTTAVPSIA